VPAQAAPAPTTAIAEPLPSTSASTAPAAVSAAASAVKSAPPVAGGQRDIIIAVDAGHGGEDPGAIGPGRLREKDVTLAIAKELVAALNAERGFKAQLVRTGDYFIPL